LEYVLNFDDMERSKPQKGLWWVGYKQAHNLPQMRYGPWETAEEILKDHFLRFYPGDFIYLKLKNTITIMYRFRDNNRWQKLFNPITL